jgi:hypothetical protein
LLNVTDMRVHLNILLSTTLMHFHNKTYHKQKGTDSNSRKIITCCGKVHNPIFANGGHWLG